MAKLNQAALDTARAHLARAAEEMALAMAALDAACADEIGDQRERLAMLGEVVSTQRDMAAGLAAVVKGGAEGVDFLMASLAFARREDGAQDRH